MPEPLVFLILSLPLVAAYAMYATGIVLIYQSSRVLNLAHGAMATLPAFFMYAMVTSLHLPVGLAVALGILSGALLGLLVERVFVRRLRSISSTAQTVGTVAAFGLLIALAARIWGTGGLRAPLVFPEGHLNVGASELQIGQIGLIAVAGVVTVVFTLLLRRTWIGLAMRGAASNRRAASLMGIDPDRTTTAAWSIAGAQAALAGILLAAVTSLHPYSLSLSVLPAFVAALIGGLASVPGALAGSAIVGLLVGFVPLLGRQPVIGVVLGQVGGVELALTIAAMLVMALRGSRLVATDVRGISSSGGGAASKPTRPKVRRPGLTVLAVVALAGWVWIPGVPFSVLGDANLALLYTLVAVSLVVLTGWVGQISLSQAAFVGVGAYGTTLVARRLGVPFPLTIVVGAAFGAGVAAALGVVALRVRGLYLAVATLIFGWMADAYLFSAPWLTGAGGSVTLESDPIGAEGVVPRIDVTERRTFYFIALAAAALAIVAVTNLRRSKTGRAFFAVRGSEVAAASLGIDVTRTKLVAFALSGAIAGVAGTLIVSHQQTVVPAQFAFTFSLLYLSIAVVGGLQSVGGAIGAAIVFAGLNELFFRVEALRGWLDVVSAALLAGVILFYPGGFSALRVVFADIPARFLARLARRAPALVSRPGRPSPFARLAREVRGLGGEFVAAGAEIRRAGRWLAALPPVRGVARALTPRRRKGPVLPVQGGASDAVRDALAGLRVDGASPEAAGLALRRERSDRAVVLAADGIGVRFGGLLALEDASLEVREGEIVGLIGPNGAGKTTMFNAIAGLVVPSSGRVLFEGQDVTGMSVHERAGRGIGRTFQTIQLSAELSVSENLLIASHLRNGSGVLSNIVVTAASAAAERAAHDRVDRVVRLLELEDVRDRPAGDLPFGTLRLVELGRALVTGAPMIMLDEPASGLDVSETHDFEALLRSLRDRLGLTMLLIEHDVRLVMSITDHVYVLDQGRMIADGTPAEIRRNEAVVKAYLGETHAGERETAGVR
ncbi:MAG: branched-chain amino acid ABC transporter permease/ATP-binding protein [Actinomycetota bacterium]